MSAAPTSSPFDGGGEMGELLRARDWASTPLGPVEDWPQSLRTTVSVILRSRFPMFVWWGPELVQIYNDAYVPIPGAKHPESLGAPARSSWGEIWDDLGPLVESVFSGSATWNEDLLLMMERSGYLEETYFTFSYSPVQDESGGIGGLFCACTETTEQVVGVRRLATVARIGDRTRGTASTDEAMQAVASILGEDLHDLTSAALYVVDGDEGVARRVALTGWPADHALIPPVLSLDSTDPWPLGATELGSARPHQVLLEDRADLPTGAWDASGHRGVLLPFVDPASHRPLGFLVGTLSPHRPPDELGDFLALLRDAIAKAILDATAREREQQRLTAMAELHHAKTEFFSSVSHEFRTPLTLILGPLEQAVAAAEGLTPESAGQVLRNAHRLLKLVNHLLAFARLEAGRENLRFAPTELAGLTEELASSFRAAVEEAGLAYNVTSAPLDTRVYVDRAAWERIVLNLVSNAFKFTVRGSIDVHVAVEDGAAVLRVTDTGTGIPRPHLERLFERFHQVPGAEGRSHEGSGIGLALVHELVGLHGGHIEVDSEVGRGTTFAVHLPLGADHLPPEHVVHDPVEPEATVLPDTYVAEATGWIADLPTPAATDDLPQQDAEVLVVDDNADMRRYLTELLSPLVRVATAADGREALDRIASDPPDLVLTDIMMPRMDGFELIGKLRADESTRALPIIALSARAGTDAAGEGLAAGADDYVVKPFVAAELKARVVANLELARLRAEASQARGRQALLAGLSHDMQGPLAVALAAVELAQEEPDQRDELLTATRRRLLHVRTLLAQLLDQAKLQIGRIPRITTIRFDVGEVVTEAVDLVAPNGGVELRLQSVEAAADPDRTRQIVVNLLTNAQRLGGDVQEVLAYTEPEWAVVEVVNPGEPLTTAQQQAILDDYEQRDLPTDSPTLGLHVSQVLADLQSGNLSVGVDDEGRNRFVLRLPRGDDGGIGG